MARTVIGAIFFCKMLVISESECAYVEYWNLRSKIKNSTHVVAAFGCVGQSQVTVTT